MHNNYNLCDCCGRYSKLILKMGSLISKEQIKYCNICLNVNAEPKELLQKYKKTFDIKSVCYYNNILDRYIDFDSNNPLTFTVNFKEKNISCLTRNDINNYIELRKYNNSKSVTIERHFHN